jgi:hypothetical protein
MGSRTRDVPACAKAPKPLFYLEWLCWKETFLKWGQVKVPTGSSHALHTVESVRNLQLTGKVQRRGPEKLLTLALCRDELIRSLHTANCLHECDISVRDFRGATAHWILHLNRSDARYNEAYFLFPVTSSRPLTKHFQTLWRNQLLWIRFRFVWWPLTASVV